MKNPNMFTYGVQRINGVWYLTHRCYGTRRPLSRCQSANQARAAARDHEAHNKSINRKEVRRILYTNKKFGTPLY